jgi:hypothetical protein
MVKKLLNEVFENSTISRSLKDSRKKNSFLIVRRQYLVPTVTVKTRNLHWCYAKRRLACASKANPPVASRLINVDELVRVEGRQFV